MKEKIKCFLLAILYILLYLLASSIITTYIGKISKVYASLISDIILVLIYIVINHKNIIKNFSNVYKVDYKKNIIIFLIIFTISEICTLSFPHIFGRLVGNQNIVLLTFMENPILAIIKSCLVAPIIEEIIFRENFKKAFSNKWAFIITTGLIFGSVHLISSTSLIELVYAPIYIGLGMWLGYIYYSNDNILISMKYHMLNNLASYVCYFIF